MREHFDRFEAKAASGLSIRHDHGSNYFSDDSQRELRFLGMVSSPSFAREPEGNGCAERFIRALKENLLWVRSFATVAELVEALREFKRAYNERWLIRRMATGRRARCVGTSSVASQRRREYHQVPVQRTPRPYT